MRQVHLTEEQLDAMLRQWKRKGAQRVLALSFAASVVLALLSGFLPQVLRVEIVAAVYCGVALLASVVD